MVDLTVEAKQITGTRRGSLPGQTESCRYDASSASIEYVKIDPHVLRVSEVFHPGPESKRGSEIFAFRRAIRRPRKHIPFDGELVDHVDQVRSRHSAAPITNRVLGIYRLGAADIEPVVLAKTAVPGVTPSTGVGKIVKPDLELPRVDRNREVHGLWHQHRYDASGADAIEQAAVQEFAAGMKP